MRLQVLDKGYVELIDHMGDDKRVVDSARISFNKSLPWDEEKDKKLLAYLLKNGHTSPFEQVVFTFRIKLPIFVMRQLIRYRTARVNEVSGRYTMLSNDFYIPDPMNMRTQGKANKQGSDEVLEPFLATQLSSDIEAHSEDSYEIYQHLLDQGLSREMARIVLPLNVYTEVVWQMDLNNLLKFFSQRLDPHAQFEIREYAQAILSLISPIVSATIHVWEEMKKAQGGNP